MWKIISFYPLYFLNLFWNSVDGGLTEWGEWGRCDKLCEPGKHRRYRTCTNPRRRCGGKQCDPSIPTQDKGNCFYCPGRRFFIIWPGNLLYLVAGNVHWLHCGINLYNSLSIFARTPLVLMHDVIKYVSAKTTTYWARERLKSLRLVVNKLFSCGPTSRVVY